MADGGFTLTDAQRAGIERTDLSLALTSGAGCGKTFVLARRYVKLLNDDNRPDAPSRIVAVTSSTPHLLSPPMVNFVPVKLI